MSEQPHDPDRLALVTGATGYIGGRLVPELLAAGFRVRCLVRSPEKLRDRPWHAQVEIVKGDASSVDDVTKAGAEVDVAYYLVHSLGTGKQFERRDRATARAFAHGCKAAGVGRIVYLGGLYPEGEDLSPHLDSRREVGEILLDSGVPTAVLRAAVIIGSGSASFEMLRYITERLPVMVTPRWVRTRIQPIAVRDVLRYLVGAARPATGREPGLRHRRTRRPHLSGDDAAVRRGRRPAAPLGPPVARPHAVAVQSLGRRGDARAVQHRPPTGRQPGARGGGQGARPRGVHP